MTSNPARSPGDVQISPAERLAVIAQDLRRHLTSPSVDSLVSVAAAHNEVRNMPSSAAVVSCLLDVAQYFYVSGQAVLGLEPAASAVAAARSLGDPATLRRALTFQAALLPDTGNIPAAIESCAEAIDLAVRTGDVVGEGATWNNLGVAFLYSAQSADCVACFQRCMKLSETEPGLKPLRADALSNLALAALHTEDFQQGLRWIEAGIEEAGAPDSANKLLSLVCSEAHYSRLLLEVNDLQRAKQRCALARRYAKECCSLRADLVASIAEGMFEVYAGNVDSGIALLQSALETVVAQNKVANWHRELERLSRAIITRRPNDKVAKWPSASTSLLMVSTTKMLNG